MIEDEQLQLFDEYALDLKSERLLRAGKPIHLRRQAYKALKYLAQNRGRLITKDELIKEVWGVQAVTDDSLSHCLRDMRRALQDHGYRYLRSERGRGYIFELNDFVLVDDSDTASAAGFVHNSNDDFHCSNQTVIPHELATESPRSTTHRTNKLVAWIHQHRLAVVAVAILIGSIISAMYLTRQHPVNDVRSVAVLPLVNNTGESSLEYISDGLTDSLINILSQTPRLTVIDRNSVFNLKGKMLDQSQIVQALGVQGMVSGQIQKRGDDFVVDIELHTASSSKVVWVAQYSRPASDLVALQLDISSGVANALQLNALADEDKLTRGGTINSRAYELVLRGRFFWNLGGTENRKMAIEYYNQAKEADPTYALPYAELAFAYSDLLSASVLDQEEFRPKAEAAALKALELDDRLPEAHRALATVSLHSWDWASAEREFKRALELSPNLARLHSAYGSYLSLMGRHDEAIATTLRARELDPLSPMININVGHRFLLARRYEDAIAEYRRVIESNRLLPYPHVHLGYAYAGKGQFGDAIHSYLAGVKLGDESADTQVYLGTAYARAGDKAKATAILHQLESNKLYVSPITLASLYLALGRREQAMTAIERGYASRDGSVRFLAVDPNLDGLRSDPHFQDLLMRVGLPRLTY